MSGARALPSALAVIALACSPAGVPVRAAARPLLVFAAADLREALPEVASAYRRAGGDSVALVFGATGDLALQIANGAPADVFFAADEGALARLAAAHAVVDGSRRVYALGRLALVVAGSATRAAAAVRLTDLAQPAIRTVVIADPAHAPYGRAAQEALEHAGLWERLRPKLVYAPNVAQAYRFVAGGNADAGLVARSSLGMASGAGGLAAALVDSTLYAPIRQAAGVVAASARPGDAARFLDYATGSAGFAVLRRYGFAPPPAARLPTSASP